MEYTINGKKVNDEAAWKEHEKKMKELDGMLTNHDWYFAYSDDHRVWTAGTNNWGNIRAFANTIGSDADRLVKAYRDMHFGPHHGFPYTGGV